MLLLVTENPSGGLYLAHFIYWHIPEKCGHVKTAFVVVFAHISVPLVTSMAVNERNEQTEKMSSERLDKLSEIGFATAYNYFRMG